jgi:hypothetical protein
VSSMVLTQVYLEPAQKQALTSQAQKSGRKVSEIMREAVDTAIAGVTLDDLKMLDIGTQRIQGDINAIQAQLKDNTSEHTTFMRDITKLQKAAAALEKKELA